MAKYNSRNLAATVPLRTRSRIRWITRILALLIAIFALIIGIASVVGEPEEPLTGTGVGVAVFLTWIVMGMLAAWRWEKLGGISSVLAGVAFGFFVYFTAGRNEVWAAILLSLPIIVVGAGFLIANRGNAN